VRPAPRSHDRRWLLASAALHSAVAAAIALHLGADRPAEPRERALPVRLLWASEPSEETHPGPALAAPARPEPAHPPRTPRPRVPRAAPPAPVAAPAPAAEPSEPPAGVGASNGAPSPTAGAPTARTDGAPGAVAAGASEIDAYVARVRRLVSRHKRYPPFALRRRIEGVVVVRLRIGGDGRLVVASPDGTAEPLLARSAIDAVKRASPFPPPPDGPLELELPIRWRLDE
jgi:protein TonB